jgi:hypothetical protein
MEGLCLVGVFLIFILAWIYEKVSGGNKGNNYSSRTSSAAYRPSNATTSKRGRCRYVGQKSYWMSCLILFPEMLLKISEFV